MKSLSKPLLLLFMFLFFAALVPAQTSTVLSIGGDVQTPVQWSIEELRTKFAGQIQEVKFTAGKDSQVKTGTGVPLLTLIQAAGLKIDKANKHHDLAFIVILEANDSYRVFFSMPELMARSGGNVPAWLIWSVDGKPLTGKEAPFRLVFSAEQSQDRLIYGVKSITLIDGIKLANRLK